jgi:dTDP-4-amino-4,6-dideoxygalactose transaminase
MLAHEIENAITPRTKAISVVHFVGIPCDMEAIMAIAKKRNLKVIEDCAIAIGSRWDKKHVGLFGDAGCFSFYPVKHITTGEGGMFVSRHQAVAEAVAKLRAFGVDRTHSERSVPGMYDVPSLGLNYRMSEMQAALGVSQLKRFSENLKRRQQNFSAIQKALKGLSDLHILNATSPKAQNSHYCLSVVFNGRLGRLRNDIVARLNAAGIGTSIYYPHPVPQMKYYQKKYKLDVKRFPNALVISDQSVALPVGPHLVPEDIQYISDTTRRIIQEVSSGR